MNDDEVDVSSVKCVSPVKKVRGVVLEVSPMKKGNTGTGFFDGRISDGVSLMRFVGFDSKVRRRIVEYERKDTAVTLSKCEIGLKVYVKNATEVVKSEKKFNVSKERTQQDEVTDICSVEGLVLYQQLQLKGRWLNWSK